MPHPMGSVGVGDTLGDRGFEVTAPTQSGPPMQALRPSTVSGLATSQKSSASFLVRTLPIGRETLGLR